MGTNGRWYLSTLALLVACDRDSASTSPEDTASMEDSAMESPTPEPASAAPAEEQEDLEPLDTSFRVEGGLSQEQVQAVIDKEFDPIRKCFDKSLARADQIDTSGAIVVRWVVGVKGDVAEAELEGTRFGDEETERCIVEQVEGWTFPPPKGKSATVHHAFYLRSY